MAKNPDELTEDAAPISAADARPAMNLEQTSPPPPLRDCIRCFQQRRANIRGTPTVYPIAARPDQFLEFYLQDPYIVRIGDGAAPEIVPHSVVVGPSTQRRAQLVLCGKLDVFTIQFRPAGFHRLFRMPMDEFANQAFEARPVIGRKLRDVEQKLAGASSFEDRACVASAFLLECVTERSRGDAVAAVADRFLSARGAFGVGKAAAEVGLSMRQFERRFSEQVGVPPKLYARIVRFNAALEAKMTAPRRLWTDIAHDLGYYDQMHMVRDFEDFTGENPTAFIWRLDSMPEPWA
jgi:methylphosphotriester-DNA--protein-cysteine methyltransferase